MQISIKGFIYHKKAEEFNDCFDRYGVNIGNHKFAISDGVTKSFFPDIWAKQLIHYYINTGRVNTLDDLKLNAEFLQAEWKRRVGAIAGKPNQKFFVTNAFNLRKPACATFVGLQFYKVNTGIRWHAMAIGDSYLFFVPDSLKYISLDNISKVYKLSSNEEFGNYPDYLCSRGELLKGSVKERMGFLEAGTFYLMTDALAEWFLSQRQTAVDIISGWANQADFERSIAFLRGNGLQNDDVSMLIIKIEEDNSDEIRYKDIQLTDIQKLIKHADS